MPDTVSTLWLGNQDSFHRATSAFDKGDQMAGATTLSAESEADWLAERTYSRLVSIQQGVAVINIDGGLVTGSAGYSVFFGNVGYDDIRAAVIRAVQDNSVVAVLLNISSGGGAVGGVMDGGRAILQAAALKPVIAYTGSVMASAALWLGSTADYVMASETAMVGSVGIVQIHMDKSKMLEEAGIKATVIRAGVKKMLANSYEPLTEEAKDELQEQADHLYSVFIGHMATQYGISVATAEKKFGQGRVFMGSQAVSAGLVDKLGSFDDAFSKAVSLGKARLGGAGGKAVPKKNNVQGAGANSGLNPGHNASTSEGTAMPKPLTDEQIAAAQAGVELPSGEAGEATATAEQEAAQAAAAAAAAPAAPAAPAATTAAPSASADAGIAALASLLAGEQAKVAALTQQLATATAASDANKASHDALLNIARASVQTMSVALKASIAPAALAEMSPADVLAKHSEFSAAFKAQYPVGRTTATATDTGTTASKGKGLGEQFRSLVKSQGSK